METIYHEAESQIPWEFRTTRPFLYVCGWSKHQTFYAGIRYAEGCQPSDLWTVYFTSSERVKEFAKEHGDPDIRYVFEVEDGQQANRLEILVLRSKMKGRLWNAANWLNRNINGNIIHDEESKRKQGETFKRRLAEDPEFREQHLERAIKKLAIVNSNPENRAKAAERGRQTWKRMFQDPEFVERHRKMVGENMRRNNEDPEYCRRRDERLSQKNQDPDFKRRRAEAIRAINKDPEFLAKKRTFIQELKGTKVCIDGVIYPSYSEAATALGVGDKTVARRCASDKHPNWQIITK